MFFNVVLYLDYTTRESRQLTTKITEGFTAIWKLGNQNFSEIVMKKKPQPPDLTLFTSHQCSKSENNRGHLYKKTKRTCLHPPLTKNREGTIPITFSCASSCLKE